MEADLNIIGVFPFFLFEIKNIIFIIKNKVDIIKEYN